MLLIITIIKTKRINNSLANKKRRYESANEPKKREK